MSRCLLRSAERRRNHSRVRVLLNENVVFCCKAISPLSWGLLFMRCVFRTESPIIYIGMKGVHVSCSYP